MRSARVMPLISTGPLLIFEPPAADAVNREQGLLVNAELRSAE